MLANRSMPTATVIPQLAYPDVNQAVDWLCDVFGFTVRLKIGNHRAQLNVGADGAVVVMGGAEPAEGHDDRHSPMVRVEDVDRHFDHVRSRGARILRVPTTFPYGERQYTVEDLAGHYWTFSQSVADVAPSDWGGTPGQL